VADQREEQPVHDLFQFVVRGRAAGHEEIVDASTTGHVTSRSGREPTTAARAYADGRFVCGTDAEGEGRPGAVAGRGGDAVGTAVGGRIGRRLARRRDTGGAGGRPG
jgi:hypothetical protein